MLSPKIEDALNRQLNKELYSAYLYYSMAAYLGSGALTGMAKWLFVQSQEELTHGMRIYNHIIDRGGRVKLVQIDAPQLEWSNPIDLFQAALSNEELVTKSINDIDTLAVHEEDHTTEVFLQWLITEQVEEEDSVRDIIDKIKLAGEAGLYMLDRELSKRNFDLNDPVGTTMTSAG